MTRASGAGRTMASSRTSAHTAHSHPRRSTGRPTRTVATVARASSRAPVQPPGQSSSAPGRAAPLRATSAIHSAGHPAGWAIHPASGGASGATASAANPRTVAGPTAASASRLQGTPTRLTRSVSTTTTGAHTAWAAAAAASTSAQRGGTPRRRSAADHTGAKVSSAPVARTESAKP